MAKKNSTVTPKTWHTDRISKLSSQKKECKYLLTYAKDAPLVQKTKTLFIFYEKNFQSLTCWEYREIPNIEME